MSLFWLGPYLGRLFGTEYGPVFTYMGVLIAVLNYFVATEREFHEFTGYRWFVLYGVINWVGFEMVRATFIPVIATNVSIGYTQAPKPWLIIGFDLQCLRAEPGHDPVQLRPGPGGYRLVRSPLAAGGCCPGGR